MPSIDPFRSFPITHMMPLGKVVDRVLEWLCLFVRMSVRLVCRTFDFCALRFSPQTAAWIDQNMVEVSISCLVWTIGQALLNVSAKWRQMSVEPSHCTCFSSVCSAVRSRWHQRKHQISASLSSCVENSSVTGVSPYNGAVMWKSFPSNDFTLWRLYSYNWTQWGMIRYFNWFLFGTF